MCRVLKDIARDLTVLYVEDNSETRELFKRFLSGFFKETTAAVNGREALELYKNASFDLVLTEINMPILDGLDLIKEIRKLDEEQAVAVCSASHRNRRLMLELLNHRVGGFITKPVEHDKACDILVGICKNIRRRRVPMYGSGIYEAMQRVGFSDAQPVQGNDRNGKYFDHLHDDDRKELKRLFAKMEAAFGKAYGTTGANTQSILELGTGFVQFGRVLKQYRFFNEIGGVIVDLGQAIVEERETVVERAEKIYLNIDGFYALMRDFMAEVDRKESGQPKFYYGAIISEASNIMTRLVLF